MKNWILAARPKTLSAAWVPVLAATGLVRSLGFQIRGEVLAFALLSSLCIQIATNFFNDVIDFKKGADTARRLGPTRVSAGGLLQPAQVWRAAWLMVGLAVLFGIPLAWIGGVPILITGLVSIFLAFGYTGGPFPLAYRGLGDAFVLLFFGWIAVWGTAFLHAGQAVPAVPIAVLGTQIGLWATALIAINNGRDAEEDRLNGKMTLAARFGMGFARVEIAICLLAPFVIGLIYWLSQRLWWHALLPCLVLPLAIRIVLQVRIAPASSHWNGFLAKAGATHALTGLLLAIAGLLE